VNGRPAEFSASFQAVQVGGVTVGIVSYGAEITIDRPGYDGSVAALVPVSGALSVEHRGREYVATPDHSMVVFSPGHGAMHLRWGPRTVVMALRADTDELMRALAVQVPDARGGADALVSFQSGGFGLGGDHLSGVAPYRPGQPLGAGAVPAAGWVIAACAPSKEPRAASSAASFAREWECRPAGRDRAASAGK
jgi:hypothetical protein